MALLTKDSTSLNLRSGPSWPSFEKFRAEGAKALGSIKGGIVATLHTKTGQYRIVEERDFQKLLGLARDVERLRGGLQVVMSAVRVVKKHPDDDTLKLLADAVMMMGSLPELPTREDFDPLLPEDIDVDPDDEVIIDPDQVESPFAAHTIG